MVVHSVAYWVGRTAEQMVAWLAVYLVAMLVAKRAALKAA